MIVVVALHSAGCVESEPKECVWTNFAGYSLELRLVGRDDCPAEGAEVTINVIEVGETEIVTPRGGETARITSTSGDVTITWTYIAGLGHPVDCRTEQEWLDLLPDENKAPRLAEILLTVETDGQTHAIRIPVTEMFFPEFSPIKVNSTDLGDVVLEDLDACD